MIRVSEKQWDLLQGEKIPRKQQRVKRNRADLPENQLERQICDFCLLRGWLPIRIQSGVFRSLDGKRYIAAAKKGTPDWIFLRRENAMLVEAKAPRGKVSTEQQSFAQMAGVLKLRYCMPRSLEAFMEWYYVTWKDLR